MQALLGNYLQLEHYLWQRVFEKLLLLTNSKKTYKSSRLQAW